MGLPVYVVNFDELADRISVGDITVNVDTSKIEDTLNICFPELLDLLSRIAGAQGVSKVKGFISHGEPISFIPSSDILLTGFCFSQNLFDDLPSDIWSLKIFSLSGTEITLLDSVFAKDSLQHFRFDRFFPVPAGYEIIVYPGVSSHKAYWFDLEFLELL